MTGAAPSPDIWLRELPGLLGLPAGFSLDDALILELTREVAHSIARPAAPLSAFLIGFAAGQGAGQADIAPLVARVLAALRGGGD